MLMVKRDRSRFMSLMSILMDHRFFYEIGFLSQSIECDDWLLDFRWMWFDICSFKMNSLFYSEFLLFFIGLISFVERSLSVMHLVNFVSFTSFWILSIILMRLLAFGSWTTNKTEEKMFIFFSASFKYSYNRMCPKCKSAIKEMRWRHRLPIQMAFIKYNAVGYTQHFYRQFSVGFHMHAQINKMPSDDDDDE